MRQVIMDDAKSEIEFATKAAQHFASHPEHHTYTAEEIKPGCFLAMRWGLLDRGVLVLKLDEDFIPANYHDLVAHYQKGSTE